MVTPVEVPDIRRNGFHADERKLTGLGLQLRRQLLGQALLDLPDESRLTNTGRPENEDERSRRGAFDGLNEFVLGFDQSRVRHRKRIESAQGLGRCRAGWVEHARRGGHDQKLPYVCRSTAVFGLAIRSGARSAG